MIEYHLSLVGPLPATWWASYDLDPVNDVVGGGDIYVMKEGLLIDTYDVPVMTIVSWAKLNQFLCNSKFDEIVDICQLLDTFEATTNHKIQWIKNNNEFLSVCTTEKNTVV